MYAGLNVRQVQHGVCRILIEGSCRFHIRSGGENRQSAAGVYRYRILKLRQHADAVIQVVFLLGHTEGADNPLPVNRHCHAVGQEHGVRRRHGLQLSQGRLHMVHGRQIRQGLNGLNGFRLIEPELVTVQGTEPAAVAPGKGVPYPGV